MTRGAHITWLAGELSSLSSAVRFCVERVSGSNVKEKLILFQPQNSGEWNLLNYQRNQTVKEFLKNTLCTEC